MLPRDRTSAREWAFAAPSGPKSTTNRPVGGVQPVLQGERAQAYEHVPLLVAGIGGDKKYNLGIGQQLCIDGPPGRLQFFLFGPLHTSLPRPPPAIAKILPPLIYSVHLPIRHMAGSTG